jgi:hypothetical protein
MSRRFVSLKTRVRYDGLVQTIDNRSKQAVDFEKMPNPIWHIIGQVLRGKFRKPGLGRRARKTKAK